MGKVLFSVVGVFFKGVVTWFTLNLPTLIVGALVAAGFSTVSFIGVNSIFNYLETLLVDKYSSLPLSLIQVFTYMGIDDSISIIFAALGTRITISLFSSKLINWSGVGKGGAS